MAHRWRKKWGQHFLTDTNLLHKLVRIINPQPEDRVLEIGPGEGALTELLAPCVKELVGVEIDTRLFGELLSNEALSKCTFLNEDIVSVDLSSLPFSSVPVRVVGNIPYNITSPILFRFLEEPRRWKDIHIMVQKEVADRLAANVGGKDYGRLTVMVRARMDVHKEASVPPHVFIPRPDVHSVFISLRPHERYEIDAKTWFDLSTVVRAAFTQRRKMLRNCLRGFNFSNDMYSEIDFTRRPETMNVSEFLKLARHLVKDSKT